MIVEKKPTELVIGEYAEVRIDSAYIWKKIVAVFKTSDGVFVTFDDQDYYYNNDFLLLVSDEVPSGVENRVVVPDWDEYFLNIAKVVAQRAKCRRRQVGAVIVDSKHRIISTGYNGFPSGTVKDCLSGGCPRGLMSKDDIKPDSPYDDPDLSSFCPAVHAEQNAIIYAASNETADCLIYITDSPCPQCKKFIAAAGIRKAIWPGGEWLPLDLYNMKS